MIILVVMDQAIILGHSTDRSASPILAAVTSAVVITSAEVILAAVTQAEVILAEVTQAEVILAAVTQAEVITSRVSRRVARRMSFTTLSAGAFEVKDFSLIFVPSSLR